MLFTLYFFHDLMPNPQSTYVFKRVGVTTKNRLVLAAMTNKQSFDSGRISEAEIQWLVRRSEGGFGIITTAATHVSKCGKAWKGEFGVFDDNFIKPLISLTKRIHYHGSLVIAQLFHGGIRSPEDLTGVQPISASKVECKESVSGFSRKASEDDIKRIINDFTSAAQRCVEAGFDGVELHGAHGYLISQFLSKTLNQRQDRWGGDIEGRSRFLIEIIQSIKRHVPKNFIVGVRLSPEIKELDIILNDTIELAKKLKKVEIDFIHLSCWDIYARSIEFPENPKTISEWFVSTIGNLPPIISTGNIWSSEDASNCMEQGCDFIGVARAAIPYPDWPKNIESKNYHPSRGPFTVKQLKKVKLSEPFIQYMRKWDGFVKNEPQ
tara:strand:+ start:382 stop:1518 length:1137 start_codon:yes stop_codon:yes gene_type:complete